MFFLFSEYEGRLFCIDRTCLRVSVYWSCLEDDIEYDDSVYLDIHDILVVSGCFRI